MSKLLKFVICWSLLSAMVLSAVACQGQDNPTQQPTEDDVTVETTDADNDTQDSTTGGTEDVKETRTIGERYFIYRIWNFSPQTQAQFEATVDAAAAVGFNAIKVHIPWSRVESIAGQYDYSPFDPMIEYVVKEKGMKVAISLDLTRRADDTVIGLDQMQRDPAGNLCQGGSVDGMRTVISFCSESAVNAAVAFYADAVERYNALYGSDVLLYLPAFTQYAESEYWPAGEYDYSDLAKNAFREYLKEKYSDISGLNYVLGTSYESFDEIQSPSCASSDNLGMLWYQFRHFKLKSFIDALATAQKGIAPDSKFALQFGSHFDAASAYRSTLAAGSLAENADIVWIDDGPNTEHEFSMDYAHAIFPAHIQLAQEIDGPYQVGATPEKYLEQGHDSFTRGCTYVSIANWSIDSDFEAYKWVWKELAATWLGENTPAVVDWTDTSRTMEVKLSQMLRKGTPGTFITEYYSLAKNGEFVNISIVDDLSQAKIDQPQSVFSFPGTFSDVQGVENWYYMCVKPKRTDLIEMTFDAANNRWQGKSEFSLIMKGSVHPDTYEAALVFKAPMDGVIQYTYSLCVNSELSDGIKYRIFNGSTMITEGDRNGYVSLAYGELAEQTVRINVKAGDMIAIAVNVGSTSAHDSSSLSLDITYEE